MKWEDLEEAVYAAVKDKIRESSLTVSAGSLASHAGLPPLQTKRLLEDLSVRHRVRKLYKASCPVDRMMFSVPPYAVGRDLGCPLCGGVHRFTQAEIYVLYEFPQLPPDAPTPSEPTLEDLDLCEHTRQVIEGMTLDEILSLGYQQLSLIPGFGRMTASEIARALHKAGIDLTYYPPVAP